MPTPLPSAQKHKNEKMTLISSGQHFNRVE